MRIGRTEKMYLRTSSHRSRHKVEFALGRKPQYHYTVRDGGIFLKLDDPAEVEKALAVTGVTKCRSQVEDDYALCWKM